MTILRGMTAGVLAALIVALTDLLEIVVPPAPPPPKKRPLNRLAPTGPVPRTLPELGLSQAEAEAVLGYAEHVRTHGGAIDVALLRGLVPDLSERLAGHCLLWLCERRSFEMMQFKMLDRPMEAIPTVVVPEGQGVRGGR